jgi:hypothetical protein
MSRIHTRWLLLLISVLGCGSGDDGESKGGGAEDGGGSGALRYAPCSDGERVGGFYLHAVAATIALTPIAAHTDLHGEVLDGVPPADVWSELDARGECRLTVGPEQFCDPACGSSESCGPNGCIATPRTHSVGAVRITGLTSELSLAPSMSSRRYSPAAALAYPPYAEGAEIRLEAEGGESGPFALSGLGVPLLELDAGELVVERERPLSLRWTARPEIGPARVLVELDIAHHGGIAARIECDVEDDGALEIAAELVTQLVDRGVAGFPSITITRRSVDSTAFAPGCLEFEVGSQVVREVAIPGLSSCSSEQPCPAGQVCQSDLTCS